MCFDRRPSAIYGTELAAEMPGRFAEYVAQDIATDDAAFRERMTAQAFPDRAAAAPR